uniref:Uncharacterized protein n=1 Tax=Acrobeloides nanus TaxID=290746 RepID=A0A914DVF0_9BILA
MGIVDYESDILEVGDSVSLLSFSAVVEVNHTGANCIFLKSTFCCRWMHQAIEPSLISIPSCYIERIGWQIANNPRKWYSPFPYKLEPPQDRMLTNENMFSGESFELLTSHFPGIELTL